MDNFFTGSHSNLAHHLGKTNFELIRHDIVEPILLEARPAWRTNVLTPPWRLVCQLTLPVPPPRLRSTRSITWRAPHLLCTTSTTP